MYPPIARIRSLMSNQPKAGFFMIHVKADSIVDNHQQNCRCLEVSSTCTLLAWLCVMMLCSVSWATRYRQTEISG